MQFILKKCTMKLNANSMLQTATVLKSNFTRPIACRVLAVKCSNNDHLNLEECTRQLTRMMGLMPSDFAEVNSTLSACALIPNQQNFTRHDDWFNFSTIFSDCQIGQVYVSFKSDQAQWHSSWSSFLTESWNFWIFPQFSGISPKDIADIAFIYTTLACSLTIWTLIWLL